MSHTATMSYGTGISHCRVSVCSVWDCGSAGEEQEERRALEQELQAQRSEAEAAQMETIRRLRGEGDKLKDQREHEKGLRLKAEKELYRSSVAVSDYRRLDQKFREEAAAHGETKRALAVENDKRQKLEKVMYRSSVVMFQQVDKRPVPKNFSPRNPT